LEDAHKLSENENSREVKHVIVYKEAGRFCGWPANCGVWSWGDEILVGFKLGYYKEKKSDHSYDKSKPRELVMARSLDGGESWRLERPKGLYKKEASPCPGIDFTHPDLAIRCRGSKFHVSYDRGRTWEGPYKLPSFGNWELTARTDYVINGKSDCFFFISAQKPKTVKEDKNFWNGEDRAFCIRTTDGGKTFKFVSWMTHEPLFIRSVMPSTVRCSETKLISALRRRLKLHSLLNSPNKSVLNWIDVYVSNDNGITWNYLSKVASTGEWNGNPPSLVRLDDGRLCVTYGYRDKPYGIRAKISKDEGRTWSETIILRQDGRTWDLGYTRTVKRSDGKLVTIYYYTTKENPEQHIAATIWTP